MQKLTSRISALIATGVLLGVLALPHAAQAQRAGGGSNPFDIDARAGVTLPASDIGDVADPGASFGLGLTYWFHHRLGVRLNGDLGLLSGLDADETGTSSESPDIDVWRYTLGIVGRITPPASRWDITANLGAGGVSYSSDEFEGGPVAGQDLSETYFSGTGGVRIGYDVTPSIGLFVGAQAYYDFLDEDDTAAFAQAVPSEVDEGLESGWTFPIQGGIKIKL